MSASKLNITIEQGATFSLGFNWYGAGKICKLIENLTPGCPTLVTITGHGLPSLSPTPVYISHVQGATRANNTKVPVKATYVDANSFYVGADTVDQTYKANTGLVTWFAATDLTGYIARMHIRESIDDATPVDDLTSAGGDITLSAPDGRIVVTIEDTVTATYEFDEAVYDLEVEDTNGVTTRLLYGTVTLSKEVTR
jgi:hypothetical protein